MKKILRKAFGNLGGGLARPDPTGHTGLREVFADDTFIVSFPKSGNTWVRFLIAAILDPNEEISFRNIEQRIPDIHKSRTSIKEMPSPRFIKSHTRAFSSYPRFVYVVRDGRDAMISYYHYSINREWFEGSLLEFLDSGVGLQYGSWMQHTMEALDFADTYPDRVLLVRYEDMLESTYDQAIRIADFCRLGSSRSAIGGAVERCSFSRLQEIERRRGGEVEEAPSFTFFRAGIHGQWRSGAVREQLGPFISEAEGALLRLGYEV